MAIRQLTLEGFRGARERLTLKLDGKSLWQG